jgi:hypothetical protein
MKTVFYVLTILMFCNSLFAQDMTRVVYIHPAHTLLQEKINKQIVGLKDEAAVWKIVYPQIAKLKVYIAISVYKGSGRPVILTFNPKKDNPQNAGKMTFESKGGSETFINNPNQFRSLPDTLVLLDSLTLNIKFNSNDFPISGYYLRWTGHEQKSSKIYPFVPENFSLVFDSNVIAAKSIYHPFELHNSASDNRILLKGNLFILSTGQKDDLKNFVQLFIHGDGSYTKNDVRQLVTSYLIARYGTPLDVQVTDWISNNFKELQ